MGGERGARRELAGPVRFLFTPGTSRPCPCPETHPPQWHLPPGNGHPVHLRRPRLRRTREATDPRVGADRHPPARSPVRRGRVRPSQTPVAASTLPTQASCSRSRTPHFRSPPDSASSTGAPTTPSWRAPTTHSHPTVLPHSAPSTSPSPRTTRPSPPTRSPKRPTSSSAGSAAGSTNRSSGWTSPDSVSWEPWQRLTDDPASQA